MSRTRGWAGLALALGALWATPAARAAAQGSCDVNNQASCLAGGDATHAITVTVTVAARLTVGSFTVALPGPAVASFDAGFGTAVSVPLSVWANTSWVVAVSSLDPLWTATPGSAWQSKPVTDLQWGLAAAGPFTDVTTTPVTVQTGSAVAAGSVPLHLRAKFSWLQDAPGAYELPLTVTITAP